MAFFGDNMKVYWTRQNCGSRQAASKALDLYCGAKGILNYNDKGRPYFENSSVKISISHSRDLWVCVLSDYEAGIDIEYINGRDYLKIAERFFTSEEAMFVATYGREAFFKLWVRKEAYVKYIGEGITYGLGKFNLSDGEKIKNEYKEVVFTDIDLGKDFKCVLCTKKEALTWSQIKTEEMHI